MRGVRKLKGAGFRLRSGSALWGPTLALLMVLSVVLASCSALTPPALEETPTATVQVEPTASPTADVPAEVASQTPVAVAATEPPATATPFDWSTVLKNIEYRSLFTQSGVAPLKDGEFRESIEFGSASETVVLLTDYVATGDLDGDGALDAAVVLATNTGGSGVFIDLAAVLATDGEPVNVAIAPLGDRVQIKSLAIRDRGILVDMVTHDSADPMCCPTQPVVEKYELRGERLEKKG